MGKAEEWLSSLSEEDRKKPEAVQFFKLIQYVGMSLPLIEKQIKNGVDEHGKKFPADKDLSSLTDDQKRIHELEEKISLKDIRCNKLAAQLQAETVSNEKVIEHQRKQIESLEQKIKSAEKIITDQQKKINAPNQLPLSNTEFELCIINFTKKEEQLRNEIKNLEKQVKDERNEKKVLSAKVSEKEQKIKQFESSTKELEKSFEKAKQEIKEVKELEVFIKNPDSDDGAKIKKLRKNYQVVLEKAGKLEEKYRTVKKEWKDTNMKLVQMTTDYENSKIKINNLQAMVKTKKEASKQIFRKIRLEIVIFDRKS